MIYFPAFNVIQYRFLESSPIHMDDLKHKAVLMMGQYIKMRLECRVLYLCEVLYVYRGAYHLHAKSSPRFRQLYCIVTISPKFQISEMFRTVKDKVSALCNTRWATISNKTLPPNNNTL